MTTLQEIYNEWQNNLKFREELKKNPEMALKNKGFSVSPEDFAKIKSSLDKNEKLDDRISK